ncbi:dGTPase inhibitor [Yersinia phage vB_YpEc11]|uniref:DGTPase inhibitor n=1 Tax=Yersinia phage vB_YpEc11 TaxID=3056113 RepID=A0AA51VIF7_9CAUD|nr:dGTPase inhibitor [Yersinia phage vB_YpEc11]
MHDSWRLGQESTYLKRIADLDVYTEFDIRTMKFVTSIYERGGRFLVQKEFLTSDALTICIWMRKVLNDYLTWK